MFAVLLIFIAALAMAVIFNRKLHETLPPAVFFTVLTVYVLALLMPLNIAVWICSVVVIFLFMVSFALRKRRDNMRLQQKTWVCTKSPIMILLLISVLFCVLLSNRMVFYYDDLSYWGLYTKNIFCINKLPHLFENCSVDYKDYTPIIQIFQYIAMFGRRTFSEPTMFRANVCLIYILLLPMFSGIEDKDSPVSIRVITGVLYVIFPHILTSQFYYRLGVDLFLALTFGYSMIYVFDMGKLSGRAPDDKKMHGTDEVFRIMVLSFSLAFLALIKSSGIVLCIFAIIMFFVREIMTDKKTFALLKMLIIADFSLGSYLSWQLFLRYSWNNGYLGNRVKDGIMGGGLKLPDYTKEVAIDYIRHYFMYPLTRNTVGITAFLITIFVIAVYAFCRKTKDRTALFICSMVGLIVFSIAHLSMYLFVFDEWEALGLLEFDRYITQYLGGVFMVSCCVLLGEVRGRNGSEDGPEKKIKVLMYAATVVFILLLPYKDMKYLFPTGYASMTEEYKQMSANAQREWDASGIAELGLTHDGTARISVVTDAWDETTQFIEYNAVPQPIDIFINVPAIDPGDLDSFIENHMEAYIYVTENAMKAYKGDWNETAELTESGQSLVPGGLYRVNRINDDKTLVPIR